MSLDHPSRRTDAAASARATRLAFEALLADLPVLAAGLPPGFADAAERYVELLLEANARLNLTRIVAPSDVACDHLLDALSALPLLDASGAHRVIDLGSGGGVPAIPLALARPGLRVTCVDSVAKKATTLRATAAALELDGIEVVAARAERLGRDPSHREAYELATARACAALPVLVELALPLVAVGGRIIAWKGPPAADDPELRRGAAASELLGGGRPVVHGTGIGALGGRRLVEIAKDRPTDGRYPRRPGEPGRRPLA